MPVRAGQLRHLIIIQTPTDTVDATGATKQSWGTLATVWAAVWPVSAKEYVTAGQVFTELSHRVRIRYLAAVTTKCRILLGTARYLDIKSVVNAEERNEYQDLMCREEVA